MNSRTFGSGFFPSAVCRRRMYSSCVGRPPMFSRLVLPRSRRLLPALHFDLPKLPVTAPFVRRSSEVLMRFSDVVVSIDTSY